MLHIRARPHSQELSSKLAILWEASAPKILSIDACETPGAATPVFTVGGRYTARGWTDSGRRGLCMARPSCNTMPPAIAAFSRSVAPARATAWRHHITHTGCMIDGFNNVSTYGNPPRLMAEGRIPFDAREKDFYELALKRSGAARQPAGQKTRTVADISIPSTARTRSLRTRSVHCARWRFLMRSATS